MAELLSRSSPETSPQAVARLSCRRAETARDVETHHAIRRAVFVTEQRLFELDDADAIDAAQETHHVLGLIDGAPSGAVRLFPVESPVPGENWWKGDRLAVLKEHRESHLAGALVRHAVRTAGAQGGDRMIAWIQLANVTIFQHLGWTCVGEPELYVGQPHQQMSIRLR